MVTANQWNDLYPVGTLVRYYPIKGEPEFDIATTRSEAWGARARGSSREDHRKSRWRSSWASGGPVMGNLLRIHFENVGRKKKSWSADCTEAELTAPWVLRQIRGSSALFSREIEFDIEGDEGRIWAGMHIVGRIRIAEVTP